MGVDVFKVDGPGVDALGFEVPWVDVLEIDWASGGPAEESGPCACGIGGVGDAAWRDCGLAPTGGATVPCACVRASDDDSAGRCGAPPTGSMELPYLNASGFAVPSEVGPGAAVVAADSPVCEKYAS
ncbi:hypothetical protein ACLMAL_36190 [Nocardia sp. CWNU-33]|uniref:hypothetical protein n=1 Tax=Nocardia sp. CWNU-33 TaxID=3392117 RepID=UPI00398F1A3B